MNCLFDQQKLEQVILYFLQTMNNEKLGTTKLLKLIYYADFDHFELHGRPVTGSRYEKLPHGPVPIEALETLDTMTQRGDISRQEKHGSSFIRTVYTANEAMDRSALTDEERQTLESVRDRFLQWNTAQIVAATHGEAPWVAVRSGEHIPYELAYYRNTYGEMTTSDDFSEGDAPLRTEEDVYSMELSTA